MKRYDYIIGIDTGVNTGYAHWCCKTKEFMHIGTHTIHEVMHFVKDISEHFNIKVRFEDARLRKWFGKAGKEQLQGAGSIKRDAKIWEDYLTYLKIDFEAVPPKNNKTKLDSKAFKAITGWKGVTNVHARDAAMLVFGF